VRYQKKIAPINIEHKDKSIESLLKERYIKINKIISTLEYDLKINNGRSVFKCKDRLASDHEGQLLNNLAISLGNGSGETYLGSSGFKVVKQDAYGSDFLIESNYHDYNWTITKETKQINNIQCFKATSSIIVESSRGKNKKKVTAWFAPSITNNFGPAGYGGLPGLILELKEGKITYYATTINFNPGNTTIIKLPTKGKMISEEEFNKIGREMNKNRGR